MGTYKILQFYLRITCKDTENSVSCGNVSALDYAFQQVVKKQTNQQLQYDDLTESYFGYLSDMTYMQQYNSIFQLTNIQKCSPKRDKTIRLIKIQAKV